MFGELRAERQLLAIEAASVPHLTQQTRSEVIRRHSRRAAGARRAHSAGEALAESGIPVRVGRGADKPLVNPEATDER